MSECEQFPDGSRMRAICEGTANLSLAKINRYRERWGLDPILGPGAFPSREPKNPNADRRKPRSKGKQIAAVPKAKGGGCGTCGGSSNPRVPRPNGWGPGSQLLKAFEAAGVPHCEECLELAGRMDRWGKRGCKNHLDKIVADIMPRARDWMGENHPWFHRVFDLMGIAMVEDVALKIAIRQKIQKAIDAAPDRKRRAGRKRSEFPAGRNWARSFKVGRGEPSYLTVDDLGRDTLNLLPKLPPDVTQVFGSARSGLVPATLLSEMLHVPLFIIRDRQGDIVPAGNGWRLREGAPKKPGRTLVIDDTVMTGNSLLRVKKILADKRIDGQKVYAAVYCNPAAAAKPDLWARDLPWPHLLEWNLFNSVLLDSFALDFDGILCHDCPGEDDDDGPRYERFLREALPLHLVRKRPVRLIVTSRLEKYRSPTVAWMNRWGIHAKELVMGPWATLAERHRSDVAAWKAESLRKFLTKRGGIPPKFYIESDPGQARRIADLTGRLVVCPVARRCFGGASK